MIQALPCDFRRVPAGGREDVVGFGGSGAYFAALEVRVGARVGRSIALSSSQTQGHSITQGLLNQGRGDEQSFPGLRGTKRNEAGQSFWIITSLALTLW